MRRLFFIALFIIVGWALVSLVVIGTLVVFGHNIALFSLLTLFTLVVVSFVLDYRMRRIEHVLKELRDRTKEE